MNEPKAYTNTEGGHWLPWAAGPVDGRSLRQRAKTEGGVYINDVRLHSLRMADGREWDCINGWRSEAITPENTQNAQVEGANVGCAECGQAVGHYDDCSVGMGVPPEVTLIAAEMRAGAEISALGSTAINPAREYALRIWSKQSTDLSRHERIGRIAEALKAQGLSMEGVELP